MYGKNAMYTNAKKMLTRIHEIYVYKLWNYETIIDTATFWGIQEHRTLAQLFSFFQLTVKFFVYKNCFEA